MATVLFKMLFNLLFLFLVTNSLFQDHDVGHIMFDIVIHVKFCMVMINRCLYNVIGYVTGQHKTWLSCSYERCHPCSTGLQVSA